MAAVSKRPMLNGRVNRVKLCGIELEGGWDEQPRGLVIVKDGSVKFPAPGQMAAYERGALQGMNPPVPMIPPLKGEIVSDPLPTDKIAAWITKAYPTYVNETCGLHVHMSFFYRINYARVMCPEFTPYIVERLKAWAEREQIPPTHPQWKRFNPKDPWTLQHCSHVYLGPEQIKMTRKDYESRGKPYSRYTFVNYCDGQHHTVEVRGLSMPEKPEQAISAVMAVVDATNEFLSKIKQRERPEHAVVRPKQEAMREFRSYLRAA